MSGADVFVVKVDDPMNLINALRTLADRLEQGSMQYHSGNLMLVSRSILEADKPMIEAVEVRSDLVVVQG